MCYFHCAVMHFPGQHLHVLQRVRRKATTAYVDHFFPYCMSFPDYTHYTSCHPFAPTRIVCLLCLPSGWGSAAVFIVHAKAWQARKAVCMYVWQSVSSLQRNTNGTVEMMGSASLGFLVCGRCHGILVDQLHVKQRARASVWTTKHIAMKIRSTWIQLSDIYHCRNPVILQSGNQSDFHFIRYSSWEITFRSRYHSGNNQTTYTSKAISS